jgi:hypothetical protein
MAARETSYPGYTRATQQLYATQSELLSAQRALEDNKCLLQVRCKQSDMRATITVDTLPIPCAPTLRQPPSLTLLCHMPGTGGPDCASGTAATNTRAA